MLVLGVIRRRHPRNPHGNPPRCTLRLCVKLSDTGTTTTQVLSFQILAHSLARLKTQLFSFQSLPHSLPENTRGGGTVATSDKAQASYGRSGRRRGPGKYVGSWLRPLPPSALCFGPYGPGASPSSHRMCPDVASSPSSPTPARPAKPNQEGCTRD